MNEAFLREIAEQIAKEQLLLQWPYYTLMFALALVLGFGAAYLQAYARKRGEFFATKADLHELLIQIKATTAVAEEVKANFSHADWSERERRTLLRLKLEELLQAVHELQLWQEDELTKCYLGSTQDHERSTLPKIERLTGLYFPELKSEVYKFCQTHRQLLIATIKLQQDLLAVPQDSQARMSLLENFSTTWLEERNSQLGLVAALETKARKIMIDLLGS